MKMRKCTRCELPYPATLEFFGPQKHGRDGLHSYCRSCRRETSAVSQERYRAKRAAEEPEEEQIHGDAVEKVEIAPGVTVVKFGKKWKPAHPAAGTPGLAGYSSALTRIY